MIKSPSCDSLQSIRTSATSTNSPAKSPTLRSRGNTDSEEFAKWHCILHLFADATEQDPDLARYIKEAINSSLQSEREVEPTIQNFAEAAFRLVREDGKLNSSYGFYHLDFSDQAFDPLFAREQLLKGLKTVAGYQNSLVLVTGLKIAVQGTRQRFTPQCKKAHSEAMIYIDALATEWTTEFTDLTVIYA